MPKKNPRKQTSARVSSKASVLLKKLRRRRGMKTQVQVVRLCACGCGLTLDVLAILDAADLRSVLGSALAQDETKGQSPKTPKRRARK